MNEEIHRYQTSESAVYREVSDELVVIHVDTGHFYYFNRSAKPFLDYFKSGGSLERLEESVPEGEMDYLRSFCKTLLEKQILQRAGDEASGASYPTPYERPQYLRTGEKKLDDIASDIAVLTSGFF